MVDPHVVKVLVVDDEPLIRMIYRAMLTGFGFDVTEAKDAKDAVDSFIVETEYNLVVMDDEMPEMDGMEATRIIKALGTSTKILAIGDGGSAGAFLEAGADGFLPKPVPYADLVAVLRIFDLLN